MLFQSIQDHYVLWQLKIIDQKKHRMLLMFAIMYKWKVLILLHQMSAYHSDFSQKKVSSH